MTSSRPDGAADAGVHVLIAVKQLAQAKSRLAGRFEAAERESLVLAMLRDTVAAARATRGVRDIVVVTPDEVVASAAHDLGVAVQPEPPVDETGSAIGIDTAPNARLNLALATAAEQLRRDGARAVLVLQADLPALRPAELADALEAARTLRRAVIADHRGSGTTALLERAPDLALNPEFGDGSAARHVASGATALAGSWPGLRLDVDTVEDLRLAVDLGVGPATSALLQQLGWGEASE